MQVIQLQKFYFRVELDVVTTKSVT